MGNFDLTDRSVVVTGAGNGIGRALAIQIAKLGAKVIITDLNEDAARKVSDEILHLGFEAFSIKHDVTMMEHSCDVVEEVVKRYGRIDVWCNNAGVSSMKPFKDLTEEDWDFNMDVNAKGVFLCTQVATKQMSTQNNIKGSELRGKIINIASMAGRNGNAPYLSHYVASKFAVVGLTQAIAGEFGKLMITANSICPGYVATEMQERELVWEAELTKQSTEAVKENYISETPLSRLQTAEDVASVACFLSSNFSDFITGEAINVNGGAWMS